MNKQDYPQWLPQLFNVNVTCYEDWVVACNELMKVYENDFKLSVCQYDTYSIIISTKLIDGYENTFFHLTHQDYLHTGERLPDPPRARRLPWCRPLIMNHRDNMHVVENDYKESNGRIRTYIWLQDLNYIVIIEKRNNSAFLVSGHYVDGESNYRKYLKRCDGKKIH